MEHQLSYFEQAAGDAELAELYEAAAREERDDGDKGHTSSDEPKPAAMASNSK